MAANEVHVNDIGTQFQFTVKEDGAVLNMATTPPSTKQVIFRKPDGSCLTKTASFLTDGSDGVITYTTVSGDIDAVGTWKAQAYLDFGASAFRTDIISFRVHSNLC